MSLLVNGSPVRKASGHFIFAHRFISGSAILNLSGHAAKALARGKNVELEVNWVPEHGLVELDAGFQTGKQHHGRRLVANWLTRFVARRLANRLVADAGIPAGRRLAELTRPETKRLTSTLRRTVFDIVGTEPIERATVCGGGVSLDEVDLATCESRRLPGLYVIGELLDTWAETGGYNLHLAWATGISAGEAVAARITQGDGSG